VAAWLERSNGAARIDVGIRPSTHDVCAYDPAMARVTSPTFVGRAAELAVLDAALEEAVNGRTTTVLIAGDAGVGKTRLLQAWSDRARARGARIAGGSCLDLGETGPAYTAVVEALRDLFSSLEPADEQTLIGADRSVLARIVPELGRPDELAITDRPASTFAQTRLFDRVVDLLQRVSATGPVVLAIEDIHWADQSSQAFLLYLVEVARDANLLLIGTYRPDAIDTDEAFRSTLVQLHRRPRVATLPVPPFGEDELREQLTGILGAPPTSALLTAIHARSEGNALFAEELASAPDPGSHLPVSVAAATTARVDRLSDGTRTVLRIASVVGRTAEYDVLRAASGFDDEALARALREAVRARLLESVHVGEAYRFRHALIQAAIYDETLPGERRRLHAAVATALAADPDLPRDDADLAPRLARHWYEARDFRRALLASHAAAGVAEQQAAYAEATTHLERMLELWEASAGSSPIPRAEVLERAAWNAFLAGDLERSAAQGRAALGELASSPAESHLIRVLDRLSWAVRLLGEDPLPYLRALAAMDPVARPEADQVLIEIHRTKVLLEEGDLREARHRAERLVDRVRAGDDIGLLGDAVSNLANILMVGYAFDEALAVLKPMRALAAKAGNDWTVAAIDIDICSALQQSHRYEELVPAAETAIESAARAGLGRWARPQLRYAMALSHYEASALTECMEQIVLALADAPSGVLLATIELVAGLATISMGAFEEAAKHLAASRLPDATAIDEADRGWLATGRARLALAERRFDDVQRIVTTTAPRVAALETYEPMSETAWLLAEVGLAAAAEQMDIARAANDRTTMEAVGDLVPFLTGYLDQVRRRQRAGGVPTLPWQQNYDGLIAGHVARIQGTDDPELWETIALRFPEHTVEHLVARYHQAEAMLRSRATRDQVRDVMAPAHATAVEILARPIASKFEALARRARIDLAPPADKEAATVDATMDAAASLSPGHAALRARGLTDREIDVLTLVAAGRSNSEIAERLFITSKTASVHVSHILDKLGVSTRVEAATIGVRLGLPEIDHVEVEA
jgi:DNA-binding CsgD family transcriptional regulator/tetratricopeptide (TPR) repeat protein